MTLPKQPKDPWLMKVATAISSIGGRFHTCGPRWAYRVLQITGNESRKLAGK